MKLVSLSAFPKSGVTYLSSLLFYTLFDGAAPEEIEAKYIVDVHIHPLEDVTAVGDTGFFKNHFPFHENCEPCNRAIKAIYLIRDPIDIMRSAFDFLKLVGPTEGSFILDTFAEQWLQTKGDYFPPFGSWPNHVRSWLEQTVIPVQVIRYTDLVDRPLEQITLMLEFLDLKVDKAVIKQAIANSTMSAMRAREEQEFIAKKPGVYYREELQRAMEGGARFINKGHSRSFEQLSGAQKTMAEGAFGDLCKRYL